MHFSAQPRLISEACQELSAPDAFSPNSQLAWKCFSLPGAGANGAGVMKPRWRQGKENSPPAPPSGADALRFFRQLNIRPREKKLTVKRHHGAEDLCETQRPLASLTPLRFHHRRSLKCPERDVAASYSPSAGASCARPRRLSDRRKPMRSAEHRRWKTSSVQLSIWGDSDHLIPPVRR